MMNYEYIEQLIDRYFGCQSTVQEEQILRSFFQQDDVPVHLAQYAELFRYEAEAQCDGLGEDFDARMLKLAGGEKPRRAQVVTFRRLIAPFCKAAAVVAVAITIGTAADHTIGVQHAEDAAADAGAVAVDPYIKASDIRSTLHVKDASKAEIKVQPTDSLMSNDR